MVQQLRRHEVVGLPQSGSLINGATLSSFQYTWWSLIKTNIWQDWVGIHLNFGWRLFSMCIYLVHSVTDEHSHSWLHNWCANNCTETIHSLTELGEYSKSLFNIFRSKKLSKITFKYCYSPRAARKSKRFKTAQLSDHSLDFLIFWKRNKMTKRLKFNNKKPRKSYNSYLCLKKNC